MAARTASRAAGVSADAVAAPLVGAAASAAGAGAAGSDAGVGLAAAGVAVAVAGAWDADAGGSCVQAARVRERGNSRRRVVFGMVRIRNGAGRAGHGAGPWLAA
jgi:hypothetical protein